MNTGIATLEKTKTTELLNVSLFGMWLLCGDEEFFISFADYPHFLDATILQLSEFTVDFSGNFHWQSLDIDIEREALLHPENYPLMYNL